MPTTMEEPTPLDHCGCITIETGKPKSSDVISAASSPTTTTTGAQPAPIAALVIWRTKVSPRKTASCFGLPKRVEPPAASTTAATFTGQLRSFSSRSSCGYVDATGALAKEAAAPIRKNRSNFRCNRESDFFGRFAADVEACWRVE